MDSLVTACITVLVGVIVLVGGQLGVRLWIEPIHRLRVEIGRIAALLALWDNVHHPPMGGVIQEVATRTEQDIRERASMMYARGQALLVYAFVPRWGQLVEAYDLLIELSDRRIQDAKHETELRARIEVALNLRQRPNHSS